MNSHQFNPEVIKAEIGGLSRLHGIAFAALCSERLLPNYQVFVGKHAWGDLGVLRAALNRVWDYISGADVSEEEFFVLMRQCDGVTPDSEDFGTLVASEAIDAGCAIHETLELCLNGDLSHAVNAASCARDTVYMYIQQRDDMDFADPLFEERILWDPLMQGELNSQAADLELLKGHRVLDPQFVDLLRTRYEGKGSVGAT